jgi:hypothetical protein
MLNLLICMKPRDSALSQPLWMAVHASNWGNSSNQCHRGGKWLTMVMMFVGGGLCWCSTEFPYYSCYTKPTE